MLNFTFLEFYCFVVLGVQFRHALVSGLIILVAFEYPLWLHAGLPLSQVAQRLLATIEEPPVSAQGGRVWPTA